MNGVRIVCKGINSTKYFDLDSDSETSSSNANDITGGDKLAEENRELLGDRVHEIFIKESEINIVETRHFEAFKNLRVLSVTNSNVVRFVRHRDGDGERRTQSLSLLPLQTLDLSSNNLIELNGAVVREFSSHLRDINISHNALRHLGPIFTVLEKLEVLDLSFNGLDESIDPDVFKTLPASIKYLDISNNDWSCSPKLSWMFAWSRPYVATSPKVKEGGILHRATDTLCRYGNSNFDGKLLLVMEYYADYVLPNCPFRDKCTCHLTMVQETVVFSTERVYTVEVDCSENNLAYFPKLPKHTRTVNLSGNKLDSQAFSILKVDEHNYDEVDNLTLDNNRLVTLPEKLLEMKLGLSFSAKKNKLTSIPYDFSQRLVKTTAVIRLSNNPWKCTCRSQITDLNLIDKIRDKSEMFCGPGSGLELEKKQVKFVHFNLDYF
jgi:Leucine-rich repeat (LRR) protein